MMCGSLPGLDSEPLCGWAPAPEVVKISGVCVKKGGLGGGFAGVAGQLGPETNSDFTFAPKRK